jgi:flagellar biosynthesis protein FlhG
VLVDADFDGADIARVCALESDYSVADVLQGTRSVHEVLCRGPAGVHVLPGAWKGESCVDCTPKAQERLIAALRAMGPHADDIVLDIGSGVGRVHRRFWHAADKVLAVVTPEDAAVMNVYAAIKLVCEPDPHLPVFTLVNLAPDASAARAVHERLARACQRFLGMHLFAGGYVPASTAVANSVRVGGPFVVRFAQCEAALAMEQVARELTAPRAQPPAPRMWDRLWRRTRQREDASGVPAASQPLASSRSLQ